uniref:dihydrofolate reductase family protein n=1 Tax=Nocardioides sp. TaxID=35761 RepID=UPI002B27547C
LDGFIADEHDGLDWLLSQEVDHTPGSPGLYDDFIVDIGAVVMGAATYAFIGKQLRESGERWPYEQPAFVFTHHDVEAFGDDITFVSGSPAEHRSLLEAAAGERDVWLVGGGALAADFAEAGMLDEVLVNITPVTLGAGRPLLPRPFDLRLRDVARSGVFAYLTYDVVGRRGGAAQ